MTGVFDPVENTWAPAEGGWRYTNIHAENEQCRTEGCMIHNPNANWIGNRENWPYFPRADKVRMERLCPHGVGHSDPDNTRWADKNYPGYAAGVHGCDGCCHDGS